MATTITINGTSTLDESAGLQALPAVPTTTEDDNDNDVLLTTLQSEALAFYNRLFNTVATGGLNLGTAFSTANGVAKSGDDLIAVSSTGTVVDLGFVDGGGAAIPVYGSASLGVVTTLSTTANPTGSISLFLDSSLGNDMVLGVDTKGTLDTADDVIAFALFMQPNGTNTQAKVWSVQFTALEQTNTSSHDEAVTLDDFVGVTASIATTFDFGALPSGQNLFGTLGGADAALVVIGKVPVLDGDNEFTNASNTINTSQGGGTVTIGINNQMFDPGEGAYFTFVNNPDPAFLAGAVDGLDQNEADDADNIQFGSRVEVLTAHLVISQTQGNQAAALTIKAFNGNNTLDGAAFASSGAGGGLGTGSVVTITKIVITPLVGSSTTINAPTQNGDGSYTVSGLQAGDKVEWTTSSVHDQVLVNATGGKFDIGGFGFTQPSSETKDIGLQLRFEDDGPTQTVALRSDADIRVDESLGQNGAPETEGGASGLGSVTVARALIFNTTQNFGTDGQAGSGAIAWTLSLSSEGADSLLDVIDGSPVLLFTESATAIVGKVGATVVFRVSIANNGDVTLTQFVALKHPNASDPDENVTPLSVAAGLVSAVRTIKDGDNDTAAASADIGPALRFEDDGPSVTLTLNAGAAVRVDESLGQNGAPETEGGAAGLGSRTETAAVLFTTSENFGQDGAAGSNSIVWSLSISAAGVDSLLDTTAGVSVLLFKVGDDVVGRTSALGADIFKISIDATSGAVTLTQYESLKHPDANDPDEAGSPLSIASGLVSATRTVKDGDNDTASASADLGPALKFEDDGPGIGLIADGIVDFAAGADVTNSLLGAVGQDEKTGPYTLTAFTPQITTNGVLLKGVAVGATQVDYWADTDGDTVFGSAGDTKFYTMVLGDQAGPGNYTFTVHVNPPPAFTEFNFDDLPSGQNLFGTVGNADEALIVISGDPLPLNADGTMTNASDTINTSKGGGSVTIGVTNQMFDPGESAFFTLVNDPELSFLAGALNGLDQNEADDADNMQYNGGTKEVDSAFVRIVQIQGNSLATMDIQCFNIAGAPEGQALVAALGTGGAAPITAVRVYDETGAKIEDTGDLGNFNDALVSVIIGTGANGVPVGVARVAGLNADYKIEFDTSADFDQVKITDVAGKFDVGAFGLLEGKDTPDQTLSFTAKVLDGDGDSATDGWDITIDGTGQFDSGVFL